MPIIAYSAHHVTKLLDVEPARSKMGDIRGFAVPVCSQPLAPTQPPILSGPEMFDLTSSLYSSPPSAVTATRSVAYIFLIPSHWLFLSIRVTLSLKSTSCNFRRPRRCHSSQRLIITNFSYSQTIRLSVFLFTHRSPLPSSNTSSLTTHLSCKRLLGDFVQAYVS